MQNCLPISVPVPHTLFFRPMLLPRLLISFLKPIRMTSTTRSRLPNQRDPQARRAKSIFSMTVSATMSRMAAVTIPSGSNRHRIKKRAASNAIGANIRVEGKTRCIAMYCFIRTTALSNALSALRRSGMGLFGFVRCLYRQVIADVFSFAGPLQMCSFIFSVLMASRSISARSAKDASWLPRSLSSILLAVCFNFNEILPSLPPPLPPPPLPLFPLLLFFFLLLLAYLLVFIGHKDMIDGVKVCTACNFMSQDLVEFHSHLLSHQQSGGEVRRSCQYRFFNLR